MTDSQTPPDLENQLAGPGGQFPGTAETLATPVGSDTPVRVKIGQQANRHLQLSREEFRARSARQREIDDQVDPNADPAQEPQLGTNLSAAAKNALQAPKRRKPGRPKRTKDGTLAVAPKGPPVGPPYPAPSTTEAPAPPIPVPTDAMLDQRMSCLERGMDMIVRHIAERDERAEHEVTDVVPSAPPQDATTAFAELNEELEDDWDELDAEPELEPGESRDEPPMVVTGVDHAAKTVTATVTHTKDNPVIELDVGLQELQQMILKRNPLKVFRQYWCQLSRAAQYNEWPPERREAFDEVFNSMVAHPKFVHQMSTFLRGSRSGNCIGNEQIARVCGMVAGFLTVYQLAAAGR